MTILLFLCFFGMLIFTSAVLESTIEWVDRKNTFYVFFISLMYTSTMIFITLFIGKCLYERIF